MGSVIDQADSFLNSGSDNITADKDKIKAISSDIYNILLYIGIAASVIVGAILGIQFMMASAEDKAKVKEALIPYIIGCFVIFGAFGIWRVAILIFTALDG